MKKIGLNSNQLKLIAAVSMLIDHVGYILFPFFDIFRIVGRLAFPIFAFCIAEGVRYTKNRLRYLLTIAGCAAVFQIVFEFAAGGNVLNIFGTFTLSICLCYAFDLLKTRKIGGYLVFLLAVFAVYAFNRFVPVDYGFVGVLVPLSAYVFESSNGRKTEKDGSRPLFEKHADGENDGLYSPAVSEEAKEQMSADSEGGGCAVLTLEKEEIPVNNVGKWAKMLCFTLTLAALAGVGGWNIQYYSLLAVPILSLYNGQYGSKKFKWWFYIFYPAHLCLIYLISLLF